MHSDVPGMERQRMFEASCNTGHMYGAELELGLNGYFPV
jgi:hypothetical protein